MSAIGKDKDQRATEMIKPSSHPGHPIQGRTAHGSGNSKAK
jgi:hypothetical protein